MSYLIGLDVGGTKIAGVLVDEKLKIIKKVKKATEAEKSREKILENVIKVIKLLDSSKVKAIGIGFPGYKGYWGYPNIPKLIGVDVLKELKKKFKKPIVMDNDAHCFVLAEQRLGIAKGAKNVVGLTLGTGIGGGAIVEGKLLHGVRGGATHFGHMIIDPSGIRCECGRKGDVEAWCGGKNMEKRYNILTGKRKTTKQIFASKEKTAKRLVEEMHQKLGIAIGNLVNAFNPEYVVLGGSISSEINYKFIRKEVDEYGLVGLVKDVKIKKSKLGNSAGVLGAACLVS